MPRKTLPWTVLMDGESGDCAITVPDQDTRVIPAIVEMLAQETGEFYKADNPAIVKVAEGVQVEWWNSVTKKMAEGEGIDLDGYDTYYMRGGDGARGVWVVALPVSTWVLGELCEEALTNA